MPAALWAATAVVKIIEFFQRFSSKIYKKGRSLKMERKIIGGKMYDTTTAKAVGSFANTPYQNDLEYYCVTLYRKRNGEFFLHREGGPLSPYREQIGQNGWGYGEDIIPMPEDDAKYWAEVHLTADQYVAIFGPVEE